MQALWHAHIILDCAVCRLAIHFTYVVDVKPSKSVIFRFVWTFNYYAYCSWFIVFRILYWSAVQFRFFRYFPVLFYFPTALCLVSFLNTSIFVEKSNRVHGERRSLSPNCEAVQKNVYILYCSRREMGRLRCHCIQTYLISILFFVLHSWFIQPNLRQTWVILFAFRLFSALKNPFILSTCGITEFDDMGRRKRRMLFTSCKTTPNRVKLQNQMRSKPWIAKFINITQRLNSIWFNRFRVHMYLLV